MSVSINTLDISGLLPVSKLSAQDTMHSSLIACNLHELPSLKKSYRQVLLTHSCYKWVCLTLYCYHFSAVKVTISDLTSTCKHSMGPLTPLLNFRWLFNCILVISSESSPYKSYINVLICFLWLPDNHTFHIHQPEFLLAPHELPGD